MLDWTASALAGKGARPVESIERFARQMGPASGPVRGADLAPADDPALRGDGQRGGVAFRRAGRRAQRFGVPSRRRRLSAGAGGRAGAGMLGARPRHRGGRRLRGRHPRRRVSRPLALQGLPHDGHGGNRGGRGRGRPAAGAFRHRDGSRIRLGRHAGGGALGVPARRRGFEAAAHGESRRRRPHRRVSRQGRVHRREAHPRRVRRGWRPGCRPTRIRRGSPIGWASAGRWPRRRSSSTRPAGTRTRRPMRCSRSSPSTTSRPR